MVNRFAVFGICLVLLAGAARSGEIGASTAAHAETLRQAMGGLGGVSGLHGGEPRDMQLLLGMIQSPAMLNLVERLSESLGAGGTDVDMATVDRIVRQSITRKEVEALLGRPVSEEAYRQAVGEEVSQDQLQEMLDLLLQQPAAR